MSTEDYFTLEQQIEFAKSFMEGRTPDTYHMSEYHCTMAMRAIYESLERLKGLQK